MGKHYFEPDLHEECKDSPHFWNKDQKCTCETQPRSCETRELVKNGGFETPDPLAIVPPLFFADWTITETINQVSVTASTPPNEGQRALGFFTSIGNAASSKRATVVQNVFVTPGCFYRLRFAENLITRGTGTEITPRLVARVFYIKNNNQYNLINIPIVKFDGPSEVNKGYSFHESVTEIAVPCDVSELTIEFQFRVTDNGGTEWVVDSVSLRAISSTSAC